MAPAVPVRRRPTQARSRARVEQVLAAAAALIGERGIEPVTMTDIAERADMAVTALYRYFPNKQAVVKELALRTFADDTDTVIAPGRDVDAPAGDLLAAGIREFWRRHAAEPFRLQLRAAIHADAELSALDLAESRRNAHTIAQLVARATGRTDLEAVGRQSLLLVELIDSLMRLVGRVDADEAEALVEEFIAMTIRTLAPATTDAPPGAGTSPPA